MDVDRHRVHTPTDMIAVFALLALQHPMLMVYTPVETIAVFALLALRSPRGF